MASKLTTTIADRSSSAHELDCYLQASSAELALPTMDIASNKHNAKYVAEQYCYLLPLGQLNQLALTIYIPALISSADIEALRMAAVKAAISWQRETPADCTDGEGEDSQKNHKRKNNYYVLVLDIQFSDTTAAIKYAPYEVNSSSLDPVELHTNSREDAALRRLVHHFGRAYFAEKSTLAVSDRAQQLQIFSWQDWQLLLTTLQTPGELCRYFDYYLQQLASSTVPNISGVHSEQELLAQFISSKFFFSQAIAVDNALIKSGIQTNPNSALIAMKLAQGNNSATAKMYQQHLQQAASFWSQLSTQMLHLTAEKNTINEGEEDSLFASRDGCWQQQLRDESLFSRHELVRTLYRHPEQPLSLQQSGYVVHQHSYESLGRHYVLIFYGQSLDSKQNKAAIQPNLQKVAKDVAMRLPIEELHHIIVLGVEFITDKKDKFMDIDLWIQPVDAMTVKERQLTKKIQRLEEQKRQSSQQDKKLPEL